MRVKRITHLLLAAGLALLPSGCGDDDPTGPAMSGLSIRSEPAGLGAAWQLSGPDGFSLSAAGDTTLADLPAGSYTLAWQDAAGWETPSPAATVRQLESGGAAAFFGVYRAQIGPAMAVVPAGVFTMGSGRNEPGRNDDEFASEYYINDAFRISRFEVTEAFWDLVMGGSSDSRLPKTGVTWYEALQFCNALSLREGLTPVYAGSGTTWTWNPLNDGYRLPVEAEWEYACRAGSETELANGSLTSLDCEPLDPTLDAIGWSCQNSGFPVHRAHEVGQKLPNAWGLFDMHGNVWEWCWDSYYETDAEGFPTGESLGQVNRGGAFDNFARFCRSANRHYTEPGRGEAHRGFRIARSGE
ncbi:MAG: formylglycine-generating enzyme family protein [bacterium]|nr:formylglycine-generating enzyme family protein [bacterium]